MNSTENIIPTLDELISDLKQQKGFQTMLETIKDEKEKEALEKSVVSLMENYYNAVLKPMVS